MLLCCVNDLNYWLFDHLGHLQTTSRDGVFMAKLNGLARYFDWKVQVIIFSLIVNATILSNTILPAQAYCRYYALKYDTPMTKWHTFRVFCYALSAGIPIFIASFLSCYYSPTSRPGLNYGQFWFHERPLPIVMYTDIRHVTQICYFLLGTIVVTIAYSLAVWYSYKTYLYLEGNKSGYTAKTRKVNKQLSICMLCQAIVSLTVACGPIMVFTVPTFLHADSGISTWICGVILSLVPICNPIVTVVIIKPYRNTLLKAFGLQKRNLIEDSSSGSYAI